MVVYATIMLSFLVFFVYVMVTMDHSFHKKFTKQSTDAWDYGAFDDFLDQYKKYMWVQVSSSMLMDVRKNSRLDKFVIKFGGKGMVLSFWDYCRYRSLLDDACKEITQEISTSKRQTNLWKKGLKVIK